VNAGTQFDPVLVPVFIDMITDKALDKDCN